MKKLGQIASIIDNVYVIVQVDEGSKIDIDRILNVYREVHSDVLKTDFSLEILIVPLGKITIVQHQKDNLYLAKLVELSRKTQTVYKDSPYSNLITGSMKLFGTTYTKETILHDGTLNSSESLKLQLSELISLGDYVGG